MDSLTTLVTELIWSVTAEHELVGSVVEYLTSPTGFPAKLLEGKLESDVQSFAQGLVIIALTGLRMPPLMGDWDHVMKCGSWTPEQQTSVLAALSAFQTRLAELGEMRSGEGGQLADVTPCLLT